MLALYSLVKVYNPVVNISTMVFDPSKSDKERVAERVDEQFPDASVQLSSYSGVGSGSAEKPMLIVMPPDGDDADEAAERIKNWLSENLGLTARANAVSDDGRAYEVTATTGYWEK